MDGGLRKKWLGGIGDKNLHILFFFKLKSHQAAAMMPLKVAVAVAGATTAPARRFKADLAK